MMIRFPAPLPRARPTPLDAWAMRFTLPARTILDAHARCVASGMPDAVAQPLIEGVAQVSRATRQVGADPSRAFLDALDATIATIQEGN